MSPLSLGITLKINNFSLYRDKNVVFRKMFSLGNRILISPKIKQLRADISQTTLNQFKRCQKKE